MTYRFLATVASVALLGSAAIAQDRLNGGFERADASISSQGTEGSAGNTGSLGAGSRASTQTGMGGNQDAGAIGGTNRATNNALTGQSANNASGTTGNTATNSAAGTASGAATAQTAAIDSLPDRGRVTLKGTVQDVEDDDEFTLSDSTGTIEVELSSDTSLNVGDTVTVTGDIEREWGSKEIGNALVTASTTDAAGALQD